jgi:chromate transporter
MVIGTAAKLVGKLKLAPEAIVLLLLAAFAAAWLRLPLPVIVLALAPISITASLWRAGLILRSETSR